MKRLIIVLDGAGDRGCSALGGKTPLQAAKLPNLKRMAKEGKTGKIRIAGKIAPESDVGVLSVLGHNPFKEHVGRGLLEAKGANVEFRTGNLAVRANFATAEKDGKTLVDRRVGRDLKSEEAKKLAEEVNKKVKLEDATFVFKATKGHRAVLVIRANGQLGRNMTNTDPAYETKEGLTGAKELFEMKAVKAKAWKKDSERSAALANEFVEKSFRVLEESEVNRKREKEGKLPANFVLLRDAENEDKKLKPLPGKWAILSEMPMEEGIGKMKGMRVVKVESGSTTEETYERFAGKTIGALEENDGIYVHLKGPDLFGHDGDAEGKKKSLEEIDASFFAPLLAFLPTAARIVVTSDHATPCELKAHSADPVPFLLWGKRVSAEGEPFDESTKGKIIDAWTLVPLLLKK